MKGVEERDHRGRAGEDDREVAKHVDRLASAADARWCTRAGSVIAQHAVVLAVRSVISAVLVEVERSLARIPYAVLVAVHERLWYVRRHAVGIHELGRVGEPVAVRVGEALLADGEGEH